MIAVVSGIITTLTALDFEQVTTYSLTVTASDLGSPPLSSASPTSPTSVSNSTHCSVFAGSVNVSFQVRDFNDCPPEFINPLTVIPVPENAILSTVLETFIVQDCDSGSNGVNGTRFTIIAGEH